MKRRARKLVGTDDAALRAFQDLWRANVKKRALLRRRLAVGSRSSTLLYPLPPITSLVACTKGQRAIDEILGWLDLGRRSHGYAWPGFIDWNQLESIRSHAKFVAFVKAEDDLVAEIESAIDVGRYRL